MEPIYMKIIDEQTRQKCHLSAQTTYPKRRSPYFATAPPERRIIARGRACCPALLLCFCATYAAFAATPACVAIPSGLVGWWTGDTNENDVTGANNPSTVNAVNLVPGEVLDGFSFGTQGYIQIPSAADLANQQFTWTAWVRPDGPGPNNDTFGSYVLENYVDGFTDAVSLSWSALNHQFFFIFGSTASEYIASSDKFAPGSFYFVSATYDGNFFRLFVNGVLEGSLSQSKTIAYSSSGWTFGSSNAIPSAAGFPRTWNGVIDEVQAFNRALSASELLSIFNAATGGECKGTPAIYAGGAVSALAFGGFPSVAPGSWIEIYGSGLAAEARAWTGSDFQGIDAPISLDGTSVFIGGQNAFIDYISAGQVNAQVPSDIATGPQQLTVKTVTGTSSSFGITVNAAEPGLLAPSSFNIGGIQYAVALFLDGTYALPANAITGISSRPARPGDTIVLYGVGFGPVTPDIPAGQIVQQQNMLALPFAVSIGGVPATVSYDGLAPNYVGLYQFNVTLPAVPPGNAALTFTLGTTVGTQALNIAVGQ